MNKHKFKSNTAFTDLLFLMLSGVTILWVLSFILINPVAKTQDVESHAKFLLTMDWADESKDDIDMWLRNPDGSIVYFGSKDNGGSTLERDDLGLSSDCVVNAHTGEPDCIYLNREVIAISNPQVGEYQLQFRVYNRYSSVADGNPVRMEVIRVNPYKILFSEKFAYQHNKQRISVIRFTIDTDGKIASFSETKSDFDMAKPSGRADTETGG